MGTPRTWDYRYCWLRDAAFVVEALRRLWHLNEGEQFIRFLRDVAESGPLQPLYGIDGERDLPEEPLPHLAGFGGNGSVRVGNAAAEQQQNDLIGELILCLETLLTDPRIVRRGLGSLPPLVQRLVEQAIVAAPTTDTSIWEFRSLPRLHVLARDVLGRDRSRRAARGRIGRDGARGEVAPDRRRRARRGAASAATTRSIGFFTQSLDGAAPRRVSACSCRRSASSTHAIRASSSTLDAYERHLVDERPDAALHERRRLRRDHSAFTICSFWWAEALALAGRLDEAVEVFERVTRYANPLGLFSEDIDPRPARCSATSRRRTRTSG